MSAETTSADCPALPAVASPTIVMDHPTRRLSDPVIVRHAGRYLALVQSIAVGDGVVFRSVSDDGLAWSDLVQVDAFGDSSLRSEDGQLVMWAAVRTQEMVPPTAIHFATSTDGFEWQDHGRVFEPVPVEGAHGRGEVRFPVVWFDGEQNHLYFMQYVEWLQGDVGFVTTFIGHAIQTRSGAFEFHHWLYQGGQCPNGAQPFLHPGLRVQSTGKDCGPDGVTFFVTARLCGDDETRLYQFTSDDGETFRGPVFAPSPRPNGTILHDDTRALVYRASYDEDFDVAVEQTLKPR